MRYLLILLLGVVLGGALVYYLFVGAPRMKMAGAVVQPPPPGAPPPGTALVTLDENFFNALLGAIFRDLNAPTFKLTSAERSLQPRFVRVQEGGCPSQVTITPEGSGVRTGVRIANGKILAPLAFTGSYSVLGSCYNFKGAAEANIQLAFNPEQQILAGQINVEGVNLEGVNPIASGLITVFVQNTINQRVNPLQILRGQQLSLAVPVQASGGTLRAQVKEVRSEIIDNALRLHINYDFSAVRGNT
jgi:hypothetical protein